MVQHNKSEKEIKVEFAEEEKNEKQQESGKNQNTGEQQAQSGNGNLKEELAKRDQKIKELEDRLLRLQAEFMNYKRRVEREQLELADFIKGEIFKKILPILDDFKAMMAHAEEGKNEESVLQGAKMIYNKLKEVLEKEGLEKIQSLGEKFNPELHEALMTRPTTEAEEHDRVVEVYQDGYKLKEKLIRPSKVVVGKLEEKTTDSEFFIKEGCLYEELL